MRSALGRKLDAFDQVHEFFCFEMAKHNLLYPTCLLHSWILYQFSQFFQRKKNAGLDGRNRPAGNTGDFFIAELLVDSQFKNSLLFRWKVLHHAPEVVALFLVLHLRVRGRKRRCWYIP